MTEGIKTLIYVSLAVVVFGGALAFRFWPTGEPTAGQSEIGTVLFEEFTNPLNAKSLEIARYDDVTGNVNRFQVDQINDRWVIPSHANYPADAEEQMQDAATSLIGLEILEVASDNEGDQQLYGVIEPNAEKLEPGATGVGVLISMKDAQDKPLAELVVGRATQNDPAVRFVRVPGQSRIYATRIDLDKLTTSFGDWIEKDLLQLASIDVGKIAINDYTMETVLDQRTGQRFIQRNRRMEMTVENDSSGWKLDNLIRFDRQGQPVEQPLALGEELDTQRVADLASALDKLEIVDVRRKPKGLGADMKADEGIELDDESYTSLVTHGFYPKETGQGEVEFFSKNGDLTAQTKEGVEYLLRFGDLAVSQDTSQLDKMNRYLMVAARVAEEKFPKPPMPELPPLPEKTDSKEPAKPKGDDASGEDAAGEDTSNEDEAPAPPKDAKSSDEENRSEDSADEKDGAAEGDDEASDDAAGADADNEADDEKDSEDGKDEADDDRIRIEAARDRIMTQYQRELDAWKEQRKIAANKVRELNARFGDWYYVISEDVYKDIHLGRAELIKESENVAEEGFGIDAFRLLEERGLQKEPPEPPGGAPGVPNFPPPSFTPPG